MSSVLKSPGQPKQIILQKPGSGGQPQIVTLVKTSQGMQVATVRSRGRGAVTGGTAQGRAGGGGQMEL